LKNNELWTKQFNNGKAQTKQMEKGWELHFSAVLNLQLISKFPDFLQVRVQAVRTKPKKNTKSTNNYGKNNETCTKQWEKHVKHMEKGWKLHFSALLSSAQSGTNFKVS